MCPIHEGDNAGAFNVYLNNEWGAWSCHTHHCEDKYGKNIIGLVRGILTTKKNKNVGPLEASKFIAEKLGYKDLGEIKVPTAEEQEKEKINRVLYKWSIVKPNLNNKLWTADEIKNIIDIPAQYYIDRGYSADILKKYNVGYYAKQERVLVPIFDINNKHVVGFSGRSIYNKCEKCGLFHDNNKECPTTNQEDYSKWRMSKNFNTSSYLYNYWFSRKYIEKTSTIILVEGPGDVWRLEENDIKNSVAVFGAHVTDIQLSLIESSWAMNVVALFDNDEAGIKACKHIHDKLNRTHRLFFPKLGNAKDVGELRSDQITDEIKPIIDKINQKEN